MSKYDKPNLSELVKQIDVKDLNEDQFEDYYDLDESKLRPKSKPKKEDWE